MEIQFCLDFSDNRINATVKGELPKELNITQFLLNRDFVIEEIKIDGFTIDSKQVKNKAKIDDYIINEYKLPEDTKYIEMKYTGILDGTSGFCPYVRESVSADFTFIRWETFCYPIFALSDFKDIIRYLNNHIKFDIRVVVPKNYLVLSPSELIKTTTTDKEEIYNFKGNDLSFAIAKYTRRSLSVGDFYFFQNVSTQSITQIINILKRTHEFMNEQFGRRKISSNVKYVSIPNKFGSFATDTCVYIDEKTFTSKRKMREIIHEFIHLGWNAKTDEETQRIRFFDEAFTNYFTLRVLEDILSEDEYKEELESYKTDHKLKIDENLVPIIDYGKYECGGLSYTIGALCLHELCNMVGKEKFDNATNLFLSKYRYKAVNMEILCNEYIKLCDCPEIKDFFDEWIYTTRGPKKFLGI
ncbi:M1 family aminopeptidase [Clostridiaceae bacterium M8S5]|nr:M1 family aminopeptidase [Clostridiaceae bacterium M8S5]